MRTRTPAVIRAALASAALLASTTLATTAAAGVVGSVYTMTNDAAGNGVLVYDRYNDGHLEAAGVYPTGGLGTGSGLGNQGGVTLSHNDRWLLVVNAGSDDVSLFAVARDGLTLSDIVPSGGVRPISVAIHHDLVYVVHAGGAVGDADSISGLRVSPRGHLSPIPGSTRSLSALSTGPAQIGFSPDGRFVLVTEKATSSIDTFALGRHGRAGPATVNPAAGMTPFAFDFAKRDQLIVSEVFGGADDAGAASSYRLERDGTLTVLAASAANTETAPCWLVVDTGGRWAFTTNTPDDSLSAYAIEFDGGLTLRDADGRTGEPGPGTRPLDMDLSDDGRHLYTLNIGDGTISTFAVGADGSLRQDHVLAGVPAGVNGLAAR